MQLMLAAREAPLISTLYSLTVLVILSQSFHHLILPFLAAAGAFRSWWWILIGNSELIGLGSFVLVIFITAWVGEV